MTEPVIREICGKYHQSCREYGLSGFAEYSRQFPIGNLSLGVRYEHVTFDYYKDGVHMDEQSRMYGNWFP